MFTYLSPAYSVTHALPVTVFFLYTLQTMVTQYLILFLISMVPLIELRGAIPVSQAFGLPLVTSYIICIIGNMIPVPIIFLFARRFLEWGANKRLIGKICSFFLIKGKRGGEKLQQKAGKGLFVALLLFVGIPLPGTGAWVGSLIANFLELQPKKAIPPIIIGVFTAGVIVLAATAVAKGGIAYLLQHN